MRTGCMSAFDSFKHFQDYADEILDWMEELASPLAFVSSKVMDAVEAADSVSDSGRLSTSINVSISDPISRSSAEADESE